MKKPLFIFAACGFLFGCIILVSCTYYLRAFGNGNFNEVIYITEIDPITKTVSRSWTDRPTTERSSSTFINMWAVGAMFLIAGPAVLALEYALRDNRHF
jgi:hypothetical protein